MPPLSHAHSYLPHTPTTRAAAQVSVPFTDVAAFDAYILDIDNLMTTSFECPTYNRASLHFFYTSWCALLVDSSKARCNPTLAINQICSNRVVAFKDSITSIFSDPAQCAVTPTGPQVAKQRSDTLFSMDELFKRVRGSDPCIDGVASDFTQCGYLLIDDALAYCAVNSETDSCCARVAGFTGPTIPASTVVAGEVAPGPTTQPGLGPDPAGPTGTITRPAADPGLGGNTGAGVGAPTTTGRSSSSSESSSPNMLVIGGSIGGGILLIGVIVAVALISSRRKRRTGNAANHGGGGGGGGVGKGYEAYDMADTKQGMPGSQRGGGYSNGGFDDTGRLMAEAAPPAGRGGGGTPAESMFSNTPAPASYPPQQPQQQKGYGQQQMYGNEGPVPYGGSQQQGLQKSATVKNQGPMMGGQQQQQQFGGGVTMPTDYAGGEGVQVLDIAETMEVVYNYVPNLSDEIYLYVGDPVLVKCNFDDGWGYGINMTTKEEGSFPLACLSGYADAAPSAAPPQEQPDNPTSDRPLSEFKVRQRMSSIYGPPPNSGFKNNGKPTPIERGAVESYYQAPPSEYGGGRVESEYYAPAPAAVTKKKGTMAPAKTGPTPTKGATGGAAQRGTVDSYYPESEYDAGYANANGGQRPPVDSYYPQSEYDDGKGATGGPPRQAVDSYYPQSEYDNGGQPPRQPVDSYYPQSEYDAPPPRQIDSYYRPPADPKAPPRQDSQYPPQSEYDGLAPPARQAVDSYYPQSEYDGQPPPQQRGAVDSYYPETEYQGGTESMYGPPPGGEGYYDQGNFERVESYYPPQGGKGEVGQGQKYRNY
ncbi:hypothetical protein HDU67_000659 [Dinochytrium kinnereticum]|nr:hypothetical protein HDU67_000659 [Dinochytrium kinnereticum]